MAQSGTDTDPIIIESRGYFKKLEHFRSTANLDSALYYNDKLIELRSGNLKVIPTSIFQKMETYLQFHKTAEAYKLGILSLEKYCKPQNDNCQACSYVYRRLSDIMELMQDYKEGIRFLEMDCSRDHLDTWYFKKAILQTKLGDNAAALKTTNDAITVNLNKPGKLIESFNSHGLVARTIDKYELAIESFNQAIQLIDETGMRKGLKPIILGNIGSCYIELNNYQLAYNYLSKDSEGSLNGNQINSYLSAEINLAKIEYRWKQYDKVIQRLEFLLKGYEMQMTFVMKNRIYWYMTESLNSLGRTDRYNSYMKKRMSLIENQSDLRLKNHSELIKAHSINAVALIKEQLDSERNLMDKEFELLKEKEESRTLTNWFIISSLVLTLIILGLLFWRYRSDQRKKSLLNKTKLDLVRKEQEILKLKVLQEAKNVQELSLELTIKNEFAQSLSKELDKLDELNDADRNRIEFFVQSEMGIKSTWAQLQDSVGEVGSKFYSDLKVIHPDLTDADVKLAVMIILNLTNKEIAIKRNIATDSVKIAKNRLKKKLSLNSTDNLQSYLKQIIQPN